jgi:hypothetical protein
MPPIRVAAEEVPVTHTPFEELKPIADVAAVPVCTSRREIRRRRLGRLALLLEDHHNPIQLFSQLEYMTYSHLQTLRCDNSPLNVAFSDPVLRNQGLKSDEYGDAVEFFDITPREAHQLLCNCHYQGMRPSSKAIAQHARSLANRITLRNRLETFRQSVAAWF